jgi:retron-type reverse transcriptase
VFYYFIQFLVGFYSPNAIFIGWAKYAIVKINNEFTEKFDVQTRVKQGDPLSDTLFSIAMDSILKKTELRANISTRLKQCTAYVDDIVVTTRTTQTMIDTLM